MMTMTVVMMMMMTTTAMMPTGAATHNSHSHWSFMIHVVGSCCTGAPGSLVWTSDVIEEEEASLKQGRGSLCKTSEEKATLFAPVLRLDKDTITQDVGSFFNSSTRGPQHEWPLRWIFMAHGAVGSSWNS